MRQWMAAGVLALMACTSSANAQDVRLVPDCSSCLSIAFDTIATIGSPTDPVLLDAFSRIAQAANGDFAFTSRVLPGQVAIYDSNGVFQKVVGVEGGGPGEFRQPEIMPGPGDLLWIVDPANTRITELLPNGRLGESFRVSGNISWTVEVEDSRLIASGFLPVADQPSRPLHVLSPGGGVVTSFGVWPNASLRIGPRLAAGRDHTVWSVPPNEYELTQWSSAGERLMRLEREASWFSPWREAQAQGNAVVMRLRVDENGLLWVFGRVPANDQLPKMTLESWNDNFDVVIEVIDPNAASVVAAETFDAAWLYPIPGSSLAYSPRQTTGGYVFFDILRPYVREK